MTMTYKRKENEYLKAKGTRETCRSYSTVLGCGAREQRTELKII